jgi:predicted DNA-binding ribbon-helix-helix protein
MDNDGLLCARSSDQKELANNLNSMARMICFEGLHEERRVTKEIFGTDLFLN